MKQFARILRKKGEGEKFCLVTPPATRIVIVGLGLIGGSLAQACRKAFPRARIIGVTRNRAALATARRKGWIHEGFTDLRETFVGAPFMAPDQNHRAAINRAPTTIVILCTPIDTLKNYLLELDRLAPPGTIVTDAGSVKGFLVRWADRRKWRRIQFVGAHPMAGSHEQGIDAARPDLFEHALVFVTPARMSRRVSPAVGTVVDFWKKICRRAVVISPEDHDRVTAQISHLPHLVASALVANASDQSLSFAASGFLDTTRVAQGDPRLWMPIVTENRQEIGCSLRHLEARLKRLRQALQTGDLRAIKKSLQGAQKRRLALESKSF